MAKLNFNCLTYLILGQQTVFCRKLFHLARPDDALEATQIMNPAGGFIIPNPDKNVNTRTFKYYFKYVFKIYLLDISVQNFKYLYHRLVNSFLL